MRDVLTFLIVVVIGFFVIGETVGWDVGVPGQTPVFVYKRDGMVQATRRAINVNGLPVDLSGAVRRGSVTVRIYHQVPESFQERTPAGPRQEVFEEAYGRGQRIAINRTFDFGAGDYTVQLTFKRATGLFRFRLPGQLEL